MTYKCSYCDRYGIHEFVGSWHEVVAHADKHPIGDPRDFPVRFTN